MNARNQARRQLLVIFRLELRKAFLSRRGLWVYLLALAPLLLFFGYTVQLRYQARQRQELAALSQKPLAAADFTAIHRGMSQAEVIRRLGEPPRRVQYFSRRRGANDAVEMIHSERYRYSDGATDYSIAVSNGWVVFVQARSAPTPDERAAMFATVFQFFYLRLAVFFGCLGIFMNLFRGELLDKSLHFYFLAPVRRDLVLAGKFLAGLVAAVAIFVSSAGLQMWLLAGQGAHGVPHAAGYLGVTVLACLGYGAIFLAAGLVCKNPLVPAAALLIWESLNPFLPALLKKFGVIYYLAQLCPVSVASGPDTSPLFALLVSTPDLIAPAAAVAGLLLLAAAVLAFSARRVRRLEIDYTSE